MISSTKLKSVDFYRRGGRMVVCTRKIPRDLTEATLSGAGLSIVAALSMVFYLEWFLLVLIFKFVFQELSNYLSVSTSTSVIVDNSTDGDFLRMDFNISFPALSCEFAAVDVNDVLGTMKANEGSAVLNTRNFDRYANQHPILVVNFYAPWCYWSNRLKPSWEKAAKTIRERYDPELDGRILMAKVDCTEEGDLCRKHHIQGYPSIRIFRKGSDVRDDHGHHDHESYYGDRDTDSLVKTMEDLIAPLPAGSQKLALEDKSNNETGNVKRPAPSAGGCRIEGYVRVKKVPGSLVIAARSESHSFDASQMNMSHIISHLSFGRKISPKAFSDAKQLIPYIGISHDRLNGRSFINQRDLGANVTIEHYLQIVKTEVLTRRSGKLLEEYEYTAHSSVSQSLYIPVVKFHFVLSPMQVVITENQKSFSHFITNVCAIIGGVFTVAGILDALLHNTIRLMKKVELGKNF
ncbi:hypothetical protein CSA_004758 [Cucumis sativus]|uniref:Uncharacterized protein n=1 Tax=Cucumis sativus TaxID=3659 RepID=A0ACB6HC65_CUCSA|nr:hypothetical protein CSA_004758 [Cucumis sativus]